MVPLAPAMSPAGPMSIRCPSSGHNQCRMQLMDAVLPANVGDPNDRDARLSPRQNPKTP